jgi:hypothetical protein
VRVRGLTLPRAAATLRRVSSARPARARLPARSRALTGLGLAIVVALAMAACDAASSPTASTPAATTPIGSTGSPAATASSDAGSPSDSGPSTSVAPSSEPTSPPASATPTGPTASGPASACTGSAENQDFYARLAGAVSWTVYCPVLPAGWFLEAGSYRLADGGRVDVTYAGPGSSKLEVREGAFCVADPSTCSPGDHVVGSVAFGDRQGELATLDSGYVVTVAAGENPSWQVVATGVTQDAVTALAAAMTAVGR